MKIDRLVRAFNNYIFFLVLYVASLVLVLIPYYANGYLILGGEGDYVLDFSAHLSKYGFVWFPTYGTGLQNMAPSGTGLNIIFLWLIERLTGSVSLTNFALIFSIYLLPFLAMYLVCKEIKATPFISFAISLFYVINPFTLYYLICINQWNVFSVTVMPLFLWVILKHYRGGFKLFFTFGLLSALFSFAYSNPPMLVIIHISIVLSTFIASYYHNKKLILAQIFKNYSVILVSFLAFNSWWILIFLAGGAVSTAQKVYTHSFAESWLNTTVSGHGAIIAKMFSLTTIIGDNLSYDFFSYWYGTIFAKLITLVPILLIVYFVLVVKDKRVRNILNYAIFGILLIVLFFAKGNSGPFGFIYNFMFKYFPFFYMFKSPVEKFGLLYVFMFSILLLLVVRDLKNEKYYKPIFGAFLAYLLFCSMPVITGNIIPDYKMGNGEYVSRKYRDKREYEQFRENVNNDDYQYRILSMPGVGNYQVLLRSYNNKYYSGLDPILMNINKPFIATQSHIDWLYEDVSLRNYKKLLGLYNIGKIAMNEDFIPWFGTIGIESVPELKTIFNKFMASKTWGPITLYDNQGDFLPRIYTAYAVRN